jgi:Flp pilus assembly protein TadG
MAKRLAFLASLSSRCNREQRRIGRLTAQLLRDEGGSYTVYMTLIFIPVLVGAVGLGTEAVRWLDIHQTLQNAADSAAFSAAVSLESNQTSANQTQLATTQAKAVAALYCGTQGVPSTCFVDGQNGATVNVALTTTNPASYQATVTVTQQQTLLFSSYWLSKPLSISAAATAVLNKNTGDCLLSLATSGVGISDAPNTQNINLTYCSMFSNSNASNALSIQGINDVWTAAYIGTVGQASTSGNNASYNPPPAQGAPRIPDPYEAQADNWPRTCSGPSCAQQPSNPPPGTTLLPGVYNNGLVLNPSPTSPTTYTFNPGVYYINSTQLSCGAGGSAAAILICGSNIVVNATGVTFVLPDSNAVIVASATNTTFNLTAPSTGWSAGVAIWVPSSTQTNNFGGSSSTANVTGLIYAPKGDIQYSGTTAATCTQIVANMITFQANSTSLQGGGKCVDVSGAPTLLFGRHGLLEQ